MYSTRPASTFLSIGVAILAAFLLLTAMVPFISETPLNTLRQFLTGPFSNSFYFGNYLNRAGLYMLAGLAMVISFQGGMFNLGGEGQVYGGALASTMVLLMVPRFGAVPGILFGTLAGVLTGAALSGLSGFFKMKWNTDELISSFLLSSSIVYTIDYLVSGPLRDTQRFLLSTPEIAEQFRFPALLNPSHLNAGFLATLLLVFLTQRFLYHTSSGYELRITGLNREFAKYGGIPVRRYYLIPMVLSGAFYGLTGSFYIMGTGHATIQGCTFGMGWNGIAIALIARTSPWLVPPAALVFAFLEYGAETAIIHSDFSGEFGIILQAVVLFFVTARFVRPGTGKGEL
ncbi:MAG: ABC transporter permease [Spirochaetota bacterium]|nr:ABC transporter permease [Spirochaetota bacterium]